MRRMSVLVLLMLLLGKTDTVHPRQERELFYAWALQQPHSVEVNVRYRFPAWIPAMLDNRFLVPGQHWVTMEVSAYNSLPEQTDDSPFIAADGSSVCDGCVASNIFAFGTIIRLPGLTGGKKYRVNDRMNPRYRLDAVWGTGYLDVWMEHKRDAIVFGRRQGVLVEIVHNPHGDTIM